MRQTMNPIATDNGRFKDGNPATGEYGTVVTAQHMNNVQDSVISMQNEIITVLNEAGIEVNPEDNTQLWQALQMIAGQVGSIAALREFEPVRDRQIAFVKGYYAGTHQGGGYFVADFSDTVSPDNDVTLFVTSGGKRWKRVYSTLNIFDFGVRLDRENAAEIDLLQSWHEPVLGLGKVLPVNRKLVPAHHISKVAYKYDGIEYLSDDFLKMDCAQITRTGHYTGWTQNKTFVHNSTIYAPFMLAFRHGYDNLRVAWVKSFDNGETWTTPEILLDYHEQNPTLGWHVFSMGVVSNRLFMLAEVRNVSDNSTENCILHSRPMTQCRYLQGGISQNGTTEVTVRVTNHGLFTGDKFSLSNTGFSTLSGEKTVKRVINEDEFVFDSARVQTLSVNGEWRLGVSFERNAWQTQELGTFPDALGNPFTHIHSFALVNNQQFLAGFHNGATVREIGFLKANIDWSNSRVTVNKITLPAEIARYAGEPTVRYYEGKVYISTRSQSNKTRPLFARCNLDGSNTEYFKLSDTNHGSYSPMPFEIVENRVYLFATERGENEWESSNMADRTTPNLQANRPRTLLMTFDLSDFGNTTKIRTQCVHQGIYGAEWSASACGVGSVLHKDGVLYYLFGDEDYRNAHSLVENASKAYNAYIDSGYSPEIYCLRITVDDRLSSQSSRPLRGADNLHLPIFRGSDNVREIQSDVRFAGNTAILNLLANRILRAIFSSTNRDYAVIETDYFNNLKQLYLSSTNSPSTKNGSIIVLHNDKSDAPNQIDYKASKHVFTGEVLSRTPPREATGLESVTAEWVRNFTTITRQEYSATMSGTAAEHTEQSFQVTGSVEAHPDGRIVQRFHLKDIRLIWFAHEDSAIINGKNAEGSAGREFLLNLWTAMPRKISAVNATPVQATNAETSHNYFGEAAEIRAAWALFKQGSVKSRCGITLARTHGGWDEPFDLLVTVEGY